MLDLNKNKELQKHVENYVNSIFNKTSSPHYIERGTVVALRKHADVINKSADDIANLIVSGQYASILIGWAVMSKDWCLKIKKLNIFQPSSIDRNGEVNLFGYINNVSIYKDDLYPSNSVLVGDGIITSPSNVFKCNLLF